MVLKKKNIDVKAPWEGVITAIQPRIRLMRVHNERSFVYPGYLLKVDGTIKGKERTFTVGVGKSAPAKLGLQVGMRVRGESIAVLDASASSVEYSKTKKLEVVDGQVAETPPAPPWLGVPHDLPTYRDRGPRRLETETYEGACMTCLWACKMAVEISTDPRVRTKRVNRFETYCFGPKSCGQYKSGPCHKIPYMDGEIEEPDGVDDTTTAHRGPDE